jgi:hypothetical protein
MANDDNLVFDAIGHVKIIDVSCPQQILAVMKWIMDGISRLSLCSCDAYLLAGDLRAGLHL